MARIVMKFGGTSMAGTERIRNVAARVKREVEAGNEVAVVVSAMAGETDRLVGYCREASPLADPAEYDVVVAAGEQITSGLLAITLQALGVPARSWLGWQLPIRTSSAHGVARIEDIDTGAILASMASGAVAVVPGFQGLTGDNRVTTLGRGGSDTSAVALAAALKADRCDIYTDVDGVYTTDPRIVPRARKLMKITYEEMLELASVGAKVLQTRSVELAMKEKVVVQVLSSFSDAPGTLVVDEDDEMERELIAGVVADRNEAKVTLTFTVPRAQLPASLDVLEKAKDAIGFAALLADDDVAKISVVGVGMKSHAGVAATMFRALASRGINIQAITTSEIKVSVLIPQDYVELAVRVLHTAYGLDAPVETAPEAGAA
ncbi:MAG: aspartate kinase [Sandarakinorhabdus sp.]|nr:aspartate kinase [Sandarakinorhabdus sp.]